VAAQVFLAAIELGSARSTLSATEYRLAAAAATLEKVNSLAAGLPDDVVALLFDKAAADREQAKLQAEKDARDKPKPKPRKKSGTPAAASTTPTTTTTPAEEPNLGTSEA
jgi:hypothetical protein